MSLINTTDVRSLLKTRMESGRPDPLLDKSILAHAQRGFAAVGLEGISNSNNLGGVLRAGACFGCAFVVTRPRRMKPSNADPAKAFKHLPLLTSANLLDALPHACIPVAVELCEGATPLHEFEHPERAFYLFGPEKSSLSDELRLRCEHAVQILSADCLNLAAAVNLVLYDRLVKQLTSSSSGHGRHGALADFPSRISEPTNRQTLFGGDPEIATAPSNRGSRHS